MTKRLKRVRPYTNKVSSVLAVMRNVKSIRLSHLLLYSILCQRKNMFFSLTELIYQKITTTLIHFIKDFTTSFFTHLHPCTDSDEIFQSREAR